MFALNLNPVFSKHKKERKILYMRVTLYPINAVAEPWQNDPFDQTKLPAQIVPDVTIENVKAMFNENTFSWVGTEMGRYDVIRKMKVLATSLARVHVALLSRPCYNVGTFLH